MIRKICLILTICVLFSCAAAAAEQVQLPLDFSPGMPLNQAFFLSASEYEDPTIHVTWEKGRVDECDYWIARITVASPEQLRTASAGGFQSEVTNWGYKMAKRMNAVLAIDGDYYYYTGKGFIMRQGTIFRNILEGDRDVLLIDEEGDFHIVLAAQQDEAGPMVDGKAVWNAFYFGPALVKDGVPIENPRGRNMAWDEPRQRMCIAQTGKLEYMAICCAAPARGSKGMTLSAFAALVAEQNVLNAYNLDGGDSTMLIFNAEKINDPDNWDSRPISDIIYFASAWQEEK